MFFGYKNLNQYQMCTIVLFLFSLNHIYVKILFMMFIHMATLNSSSSFFLVFEPWLQGGKKKLKIFWVVERNNIYIWKFFWDALLEWGRYWYPCDNKFVCLNSMIFLTIIVYRIELHFYLNDPYLISGL